MQEESRNCSFLPSSGLDVSAKSFSCSLSSQGCWLPHPHTRPSDITRETGCWARQSCFLQVQEELAKPGGFPLQGETVGKKGDPLPDLALNLENVRPRFQAVSLATRTGMHLETGSQASRNAASQHKEPTHTPLSTLPNKYFPPR